MKLSWKDSKDYTGFVKFIGKMVGTGSPRCFYLGRDRAEAELTAAKLKVAYNLLVKSGNTGWTPETIKAVLGGPSLVARGTDVAQAEQQAALALSRLRLHDALDQYIEYERLRAPSQISWQLFYGIECRVSFLKRNLKNERMSEIGFDQVAQYVSHIASRPKSEYLGRKVGVTHAWDGIKVLRTALDWCDMSGRWDAPKRFERLFKLRRRNLLTAEERQHEHRGVETFTVAELRSIMAAARTKWHRVIIGTALNFAMTQSEISTIRRRHFIDMNTESPILEKWRDKTDVFCRWGFIFPEVAEGIRWVMSTHRYEFVFVGADGEPLVDINEKVRRDTIQQWWSKLVHAAGSRYLPFKFLRKTAADMLRQLTDRDTSEAFLSHVNEGVAKFYTNHDWDKLAAGLRLLHQKLQPIFEVPEPKLLIPQKRKYRVVPALAGKTRKGEGVAAEVITPT